MIRSMTRAVVGLGAVLLVSAAGAGVASADATTVYEHGGSNMGECSAYLGQLDTPENGSVRASVNHVIKEFGAFLGLSSPGDLYSVRAKQQVNLPPAQECLPRQLPGGGVG